MILSLTPAQHQDLLDKLPHWCMQFRHACMLQSNEQAEQINYIVAVTTQDGLRIHAPFEEPFEQLKAWADRTERGLYGFLSYDLKNAVEDLSSKNFDGIGLPLLHFFEPEIWIEIKKNSITIQGDVSLEQILATTVSELSSEPFDIHARESQSEYEGKIAQVKQHIIEGDVYEMNYCTEFYAEVELSPAPLYQKLNAIAKAPFSSFYKCGDKYLICGSPERFVAKKGNRIWSQPIKGTAPRAKNAQQDVANRQQLQQSQKDQAENVMIVDLVRNDLARTCKAGTVQVDELFGIYGFEQVWHMISTISGELREDIHFVDAIKAAFPMGSMTGAPKVMSMKLIEQYEETQRGLYSGAVGYITPNGDFDFNVVIRSILYNAATHYLSFHVGGAIVYDSIPEQEYQECWLKAESMRKALGG